MGTVCVGIDTGGTFTDLVAVELDPGDLCFVEHDIVAELPAPRTHDLLERGEPEGDEE